MNFDRAFDRLIGNEGGFQILHDDDGNWTGGRVGLGELIGTIWGISAPVARAAGWTGDMRNMPRDFSKSIYLAKYWSPCQCEQYDGAVAFQVFDGAVNHGNDEAIKLLQYAVGVPQDGVPGAQTIGATRAMKPAQIVVRFIAQRLRFWDSLPKFSVFGKGWNNRAAHDLDLAAEDF